MMISPIKTLERSDVLPLIKIRPMLLDDIDQVKTIDQTSFSLPWPEHAYYYELTENPNALLWVAEAIFSGGERLIVGMTLVWLILDEAHIATLAVLSDYRRIGIAKQLLAVALNVSKSKGANQALLEVRASNQPALMLYRNFGFDMVGRRPRYYKDNNEDAILMTASLFNLEVNCET